MPTKPKKKQIEAATAGWIVLMSLDGPPPNGGRLVPCRWSVGGGWDGLSNALYSDHATAVFDTWKGASQAITKTLASVKKHFPSTPKWAHRDAYLIVPVARVEITS